MTLAQEFEDYGRKQGFKLGKAQGIEQGIERGKEEGKLEVARKLYLKDLSLQNIASLTGLPITLLQQSLKK